MPGQPWALGLELGGWHDALRRIEPFVTDPDVRDRIAEMNAVLEAYGAASLR